MTAHPTSMALRPLGNHAEPAIPAVWDGRREYVGQGSGPKILGLGRAFLRRSKLLLLTVVVLNGLAFYGVRTITPRYTASADLIVSPREEQVVDLKAVLSGLSGASDVIESETQVLRSREIARSVVQKLKLDQMPEFNPALREPGLRQRLTDAAAAGFGWLRTETAALQARLGLPQLFADPPNPNSASPPSRGADSWVNSWVDSWAGPPPSANGSADGNADPLDPLSAPVDRFLSQLDVASKGRSRVITISFTSTDATLAAKVPNAVAEAYIANQLLAKTNATSQATKWLDERVAELREQLLAADEAVEAYRRRAGIVPIRDSTLLNQQITEASQELMRAQEQVAVSEGRVSAMARINPNALGLGRDLASAKAREATLAASLAALRAQVDVGSQSEIGMRALQREADADRNLYDRLLARARETKVQSGLQQADATIISRAERPGEASFPKPAIILPLFFIASLIVGSLLVIWLESLDRGFTSVGQLELGLGIAVMGATPMVRLRRRRRAKIASYCLDHPRSSFTEAIRNLYTSLMLSGKDAAPKTILFASSLPGEGKSSAALAMARLMASCGKRVIVVDCDHRNPSLHTVFDVNRTPGLTECLTGLAELDAAVRKDPLSSALLLPVGGQPITAPDLFGSPAMRQLLGQLSKAFDLVLLDGAPVLGVSDTRHLARLADVTVFVVRWHGTRCSAAGQGLRQLVDAGANVAGTLLTMVDDKVYQRDSAAGPHRRQLALYLNT